MGDSGRLKGARAVALVVCLLLAVLGAIVANSDSWSSALTIVCVVCIFCHLLQTRLFFFIVVAIGILLSIWGTLIARADSASSDSDSKWGFILMAVAMLGAFLCMAPADSFQRVKGSFSSGGRTLFAGIFFLVNLIGSIIYWIDLGGGSGATPMLLGFVFCFAFFYGSREASWITIYFATYSQYTYLAPVVGGNSSTALTIASVLIWTAHVLFVLLLLMGMGRGGDFGDVLASAKNWRAVLLVLFVVLAIVATVMLGTSVWLCANGIMSCIFLLLSVLASGMAHVACFILGVALCLRTTPDMVANAHLADYNRRHLNNNSHWVNQEIGWSLLLVGIWGAFLVGGPKWRQLAGLCQQMKTGRAIAAVGSIAFLINAVACLLCYFFTPDLDVGSLRHTTLLMLNGFFFLVACFVETSVSLPVCIFFSTYILTPAWNAVNSSNSRDSVLQVGFAVCFGCLCLFLLILILLGSEGGGGGGGQSGERQPIRQGQGSYGDSDQADVEQGGRRGRVAPASTSARRGRSGGGGAVSARIADAENNDRQAGTGNYR